jgi:hypothetical protein
MNKYGEHDVPGHARWKDLINIDNATCFAFVRNPWDRTVARYTFMLKVIERERKFSHNYDKKSFEEFLEERHEWGNIPFFWYRVIHNWFPQMGYVTDEKGKNRCDVLRFEHYQQDASDYLGIGQVNYHNVSNGDIVEGRSKVVKRKDYREFYNDKTIQTVADWYKDDIDFFGFDFDTTATRNIWAT